ncbi:MAG: substrate-binding domain-containing protein [Oscillospiraceae bacterium]|jgi:ABC-type sugar transport system substrate-binding protein
MKRLLAILLALAMCFVLFAGCDGSKKTDDGKTDVTAGKSDQSTAQKDESKPDAGNEKDDSFSETVYNGGKQCWILVPTTDAPSLITICNSMGEMMAEKGFTYEIKDCKGDDANYVTYIENAITAGDVGVLMVAAMSVSAIQDACQEAMKAGIILVMLGADPMTPSPATGFEGYGIDAVIITSYALTGYYCVKTAEEFAKLNKDVLVADENGIPVAVNTYYDIEDGAKRSNAMIGELYYSDTLYCYNEKSFYGDDAQTMGYDWAQTVMTSNPNVRIFLTYEPDAALGVCSYLEEYAADNGLDLREFCVINNYLDENAEALYDKAVSDPASTAYKGYVSYGGTNVETGQTLAKLALGRIDGTYSFGYRYVDQINVKTTFGYEAHWEDGMETPAAEYESLDWKLPE